MTWAAQIACLLVRLSDKSEVKKGTILNEDLDYLFKRNSTTSSIFLLKYCKHTFIFFNKTLRNGARINERLILEAITVTG